MIKLTSKVISVYDRKTSMRLTDMEWYILDKICRQEKVRRKDILELIEENHSPRIGFTSSVRLFALIYMYNQALHGRSTLPPLQKSLSSLK